jgi:hypothetical protein
MFAIFARRLFLPTTIVGVSAHRVPATVPVPRVRPLRRMLISRLRPWPDNPRTISEERLADLKRSLIADPEMLLARPLVALPDGTVISGNQRLRAAIELGWHRIPTVTADLDPEHARLCALRDNNSYGDWDQPLLAELLGNLVADGIDMTLAGFADADLDRILGSLPTLADPDDVPDLPTTAPRSRLGGVYELGPHRLACGDARDSDLLATLARADTPELLLLAVAFAVLVLVTGRVLGLRALLGLAARLVVVVEFVIPAILHGRSPRYLTDSERPPATHRIVKGASQR